MGGSRGLTTFNCQDDRSGSKIRISSVPTSFAEGEAFERSWKRSEKGDDFHQEQGCLLLVTENNYHIVITISYHIVPTREKNEADHIYHIVSTISYNYIQLPYRTKP